MASQDSEMAATQIEMMAKRAEEGDLGRIKLDDQRMDECQLGGINIFYFLFCINKIRRKIIILISTVLKWAKSRHLFGLFFIPSCD